MSRLGFKSVVYHGDVYLGELETVPVNGNFRFPNNEIRIHHFAPSSKRCHPLSVLQTVSASVRCKLEPGGSSSTTEQLIKLHVSCFYSIKTAVVLLGNEEFHLVAMPSKQKRFPCFWCYSVPVGVYDSSLWMLDTRCLAIVFDLDETLVVANSMKSIDARIDYLTGWIEHETDPIRESGMTAEMRRYVEDRELLKQYAETDCVMDGGKVYTTQEEEVPLLSDGRPRVVRPVVRLPEKNIVLTRINPENRGTSLLVRLRSAWEDLKNYLTARGRKRYDVYVCTKAEREYALEMWRLLDPEARLISEKQRLDRVVCVKSGAKKSLLNVFRNGNGHPKMAMVIDDRLNVWEDKDQPRVHVVPPFSPYYAPQAEIANDVPVLRVVRIVACSVRGGFFKEFDGNLLRRISEISYEDEIGNLPCSPDLGNFLISGGDNFVPNGNPSIPIAEGLNGPEVAQRLEEKNVPNFVSHPMANNIESKTESSKLQVVPVASAAAPAHTGIVLPSEKPYSSVPAGLPHVSLVENEETNFGNDSQRQSSLQCGGLESDGEKMNLTQKFLTIGVVQEIARRCGCKVEFRPAVGTSDDLQVSVGTSDDLQVSVEVFVGGEKIGVGMGKSIEDAQRHAAENVLICLAETIIDMNSRNGVLTKVDSPATGNRPNQFEGDGCKKSKGSKKFSRGDGCKKSKGSKKFSSFLEFKMVDFKSVISQVQELQVILHDIHAEGMILSESFKVAAIIEKLPPEWKIFKNYLEHRGREMSVEELVVRLSIEEDSLNSSATSAKFIEHGQNSKGNKSLGSSGKGAVLGPKGGVSKKIFFGKCYNCGGIGHKALDCKKPKRNCEANMAGHISQDVFGMHLATVVSKTNLVESSSKEWCVRNVHCGEGL